jgi:hypothetical protein
MHYLRPTSSVFINFRSYIHKLFHSNYSHPTDRHLQQHQTIKSRRSFTPSFIVHVSSPKRLEGNGRTHSSPGYPNPPTITSWSSRGSSSPARWQYTRSCSSTHSNDVPPSVHCPGRPLRLRRADVTGRPALVGIPATTTTSSSSAAAAAVTHYRGRNTDSS